MKRIVIILMCAVAALSAFAEWPSVEIDGLRYEIIDNKYAVVSLAKNGTEMPGDIVVKDYIKVNGIPYPVTIVDIIVQHE